MSMLNPDRFETSLISFVGVPLGLSFLLITSLLLAQAARERPREADLYRHRILGTAFFENEATITKAIDEFQKCVELYPSSAEERINLGLAFMRSGKLDAARVEFELAQRLSPGLPHSYYNLGIIHKKRGDFKKAIIELEGAKRLDPETAAIHYNLGMLYRASGEESRAVGEFYATIKLDPRHMSAHFQISNSLNQQGKTEEAAKEFKIFTDLKKQAALEAPTDPERSKYSDPIVTIRPQKAAPDSLGLTKITFVDATESARLTQVETATQPVTMSDKTAPIHSAFFVDYDNNGTQDLLVISKNRGTRLFRNNGDGTFAEVTRKANLATDFKARGVGFGDFDNDGYVDFYLLGMDRNILYRNNKDGTFADVTAQAGVGSGRFLKAVWFDYDHDNDLDLFAVGPEQTVLYRNNGDGTFTDVTQEAGLADKGCDVLVGDFQNRNATDVFLVREDGSSILFTDLRSGKFKDSGAEFTIDGAQKIVSAKSEDFNNDGLLDLLLATDKGFFIFQNQGGGKFKKMALAALNKILPTPSAAVAALDYNNDGFVDILAAGEGKNLTHLFANEGDFLFRPVPQAFERVKAELQAAAITTWTAADYDQDGDLDLLGVTSEGKLLLFKNQGGNTNRWLALQLEGRKSPKTALGAKVEVRAGLSYQRKQVVSLPLHIGLGNVDRVDTVRITWPNGIIQNDVNVSTNQTLKIKELERFAGSCPSLFTWTGDQFTFVTDAFLAGPTGVPLAAGKYFPLKHDEYIKIDGSLLKPKNGFYTIQVTEERYEVDFFDHAKLLVVDHPSHVIVYPNERFAPPVFPEFKIFTAKNARPPVSAVDDHGHNVLPLIEKIDRKYPNDFKRLAALPALAERHALTLDLGDMSPARRIMLYLTGWFAYFDSSTNIAISQTHNVRFVMPYLQVKAQGGEWVTVIENIGLPQGANKTVPVDLTGKFLTEDYHVRIVTNLPLYWDRILVDSSDAGHPIRITELPIAQADVHFRGFSTPIIHPGHLQPELFDYQKLLADIYIPWNQISGNYTRYGAVRELLEKVDDKFVIFGSGDELTLQFDARRAPPLPEGWARDFLLYLDGWVKDGDLNTAYGDTVQPLPFHGMSGYPYGAQESYPSDADHREYLHRYNTRKGLVLIPPLHLGFHLEPKQNEASEGDMAR